MDRLILNKYPQNKMLFKSESSTYEGWQKNACIFGIAHHDDPLPFVDKIPSHTTSFYMYFGEGNLEILENLIKSGVNENLEQLTIGFEHANAKYGFKDYSKISELLSSVNFPKLKSFTYGDDFLLINEDAYYPYLGDITRILSNMPVLENLDLCGVFKLEEELSLKVLKDVSISLYWVTDEKVGTISQRTLDILLKSDFESLAVLDLDLNTYNSYSSDEKFYYELNEILLLNFRSLKFLYICGYFKPGTINRLSTALSGKLQKLSIDDMRE